VIRNSSDQVSSSTGRQEVNRMPSPWYRTYAAGAVAGLIVIAGSFELFAQPLVTEPEVVRLPEILVTAPTRLPEVPLPTAAVPASVQVITGDEIRASGAVTLQDFMQQLPGVSLNDEQGNSYQPDLSFRGFTGTPVTGVPQGISVFVDGVRINEPAVEEINFDLLPLDDIERIELIRGPTAIFGRNTLAGSLNIITRRGGVEREIVPEISGGSFGRQKYRVHVGGTEGPVDYYVSGTHFAEDGFRDESEARVAQFFGKLGYRQAGTDISFSYQYQNNNIQQPGSLPLSILQVDREQNFTGGDFFQPVLHQATLNAHQALGRGLSLAANAYLRKLDAEQFNVSLIGENSRLFNDTLSAGGIVQLSHEGRLWGRRNLLTVGVEYTSHDVEIRVFEEQNERSLRLCIEEAIAKGEDPAEACTTLSKLESDLSDRQNVWAFYLQDTAELGRGLLLSGDSLILTGAVRYDYVSHDITDRSPAEPGKVSGSVSFNRVTPRAGINYNLSDRYGVYFSYSEGFRAPAFLELTCADPDAPCVGIQAGVAPDTGLGNLRPVKATNYEVGLRARPVPWLEGSVALYRTDVRDDIFSVSPAGTITIFFQNIGDTRREGMELGLRGIFQPFEAFVNYAYTRATFEEDLELASPRTPGVPQQVKKGSEIPLTPNHRVNAGLRYRPVPWLTLSLGMTYVGDQFFRGDDANTQPKLDDYVVLNAGIDARWNRFSGYLKINNLLNNDYETFGTFAPNAKVPGDPIEPFVTPAPPINVLIGAGYRF
jgi:outer membrane receptor protein involved in Fe transport